MEAYLAKQYGSNDKKIKKKKKHHSDSLRIIDLQEDAESGDAPVLVKQFSSTTEKNKWLSIDHRQDNDESDQDDYQSTCKRRRRYDSDASIEEGEDAPLIEETPEPIHQQATIHRDALGRKLDSASAAKQSAVDSRRGKAVSHQHPSLALELAAKAASEAHKKKMAKISQASFSVYKTDVDHERAQKGRIDESSSKRKHVQV
jgi:hypothetical protein